MTAASGLAVDEGAPTVGPDGMACVPHCPVINRYSGKHLRECRPAAVVQPTGTADGR